MQEIICKKHSMVVCLPDKDTEFLSGKYHHNIEQCKSHHKQFPTCRFEEVKES